ncbi:glycosyltransferase family 61 protein [Acidisphaera rubrifaciens]|uniref:Capsule polysaccharide biosynthesis protein n=1 Tax=Acidisphaera rubrifaciens HS-AP3 TaxID=1231350 RepID=A0A0D6P2S9_9PROT|nr:glycosyltransferase family 61 protein [Acidisphaera rubrifaciens]GAN75977.1 capsule polysaccharide biosynthesis protein [Acidisphaera rubrifaciens HS-AP3]
MIPTAVADLRACADRADDTILYLPRSPERRSLPAPPRFVFGDCPAATAARFYDETWEWESGLYVARDVDVFGDYLLARGDTLFRCRELYLNDDILAAHLRVHAAIATPPRLHAVPGACIALAVPGHVIWGHWLVDLLPRLAALHASGFDPGRVTYLLPSNTPAWGDAWLGLLGIPAERILRYDPLYDRIRAEQLLIPTLLRCNSRTTAPFAAAVRWLAATIAARHGDAPHGPARLFVSRAQSGREHRRLTNRARIETLAAEAGFAIVHPDRLPLIDQVRLFAGARQIIGEYGSALHGTIFAPPGTVVAALRGDGSPVAGFLQSAIGHALGQPTGYVFGRTGDDPLESFTVEEDAMRRCLDHVFGAMPLDA